MEKKLECKNLVISFRTDNGKVQAVRNVSFDLYKGETLAIVGESGSGKSVTNRAIMGILAPNAIVEGGQIVYDGQDLLKISEEDFHKIRGDKIAMIFQDPMSSLNPIMKIGRQLTEAMLLKSKASMKSARRDFNEKLKLLNLSMDEAMGEGSREANKEACHTFDLFCIKSTKLEGAYNEIHRHGEELILDIENFLFLVEKKQKVDPKRSISAFVKGFKGCAHPDIVVMDEENVALTNALTLDASSVKGGAVPEDCIERLKELKSRLCTALERQKPNYFTLGYYMLKNPTANVDDMPIEELTSMTRRYLDENFMLAFISSAERALKLSFEKSLDKKAGVISEIDRAIEFFGGENLDKKAAYGLIDQLSDKVWDGIDKLAIHKSSVEYTFKTTIKSSVDKYFDACLSNPREQARFDRQTEKYQALVAKGKKPEWKVIPLALIDLDLAKSNIIAVLQGLKGKYEKDLREKDAFDPKESALALIEYFKEKASAVVYKVTRKMAKAKAIKIMDEVGIPDPAIRYNQYPFEFSGGMRQRIVIAIALAANPDILICDEPTTALDVTIQSQILELINKLKKERGLTVIFITHDLGVVANMADRIAVMYAGKIVEYGTAEDVFYEPRHPYTWALLSSMPDLDTDDKLDAIPGTPPNMIYPPKGDAFAARNKYAMQIDFEEQPPMFKVSDTHYAATWLLHENAPKIDPPKQVTDRINRMKRLQEEA